MLNTVNADVLQVGKSGVSPSGSGEQHLLFHLVHYIAAIHIPLINHNVLSYSFAAVTHLWTRPFVLEPHQLLVDLSWHFLPISKLVYNNAAVTDVWT